MTKAENLQQIVPEHRHHLAPEDFAGLVAQLPAPEEGL